MGSEELSPFFLGFFFFCFSSPCVVFLCFFFVFIRFSPHSPRTRANNCNLLEKCGISLRPRLHRPHSALPDGTFRKEFWKNPSETISELLLRFLSRPENPKLGIRKGGGKRIVRFWGGGLARETGTTSGKLDCHVKKPCFCAENAKSTPQNPMCQWTTFGTKRTSHFLGPKSAPFCCKNANLPNRTCFTRIRGGGKGTRKCPLQTQFWRPQKVGIVWSVPVSSKESDIA